MQPKVPTLAGVNY